MHSENKKFRFIKHESNKLAMRRARFSKSGPSEIGLVSKGEDLRLKTDKVLRRKLYDQTIQQIQSIDLRDRSRCDNILMNFRKLRESILEERSTKEVKSILKESLKFSISVLNYQSYVPTIKELLDRQKLDHNFMCDEEVSEVWTYLVLHIVHFDKEYEKGLNTFFEHVGKITDCMDVGEQNIKQLNDSQLVYQLISAYTMGNHYLWLQICGYLQSCTDEKRKRYYQILSLSCLREERENMMRDLEISHFVLSAKAIERFTSLKYEEIANKYGFKWELNEKTGMVTLRHRRGK